MRDIELSELLKNTLQIFEIENVEELSEALKKTVLNDDLEKYLSFSQYVFDLEKDWLQMIYQYHLADRKDKKQDYTPKTIALLMSEIANINNPEEIIDMCAGSGALTIQAWKENKNAHFECQEFDEQVIPILLFNLALRNIDATVKHMDVLENEVFAIYTVEKRECFGKVVEHVSNDK